MLMIGRRRKIIAFFGLIVDILALILLAFSIHAGAGNFVSLVYIFIVFFLLIVNFIVYTFLFWRPWRARSNGETQQMRQSRSMPKDE